MNKKNLKIKGMTCAACAQSISRALNKNAAIKKAEINFATKKAFIEYDGRGIDIDEIEEIIKKSGYKVEKSADDSKDIKKAEKKLFLMVVFSILLSLPLFLRMFWTWNIGGNFFGASLNNWLQLSLALVVVFFFGRQFHKNAFKAFLNKRADMDTLISIGTLSAFFYSFWGMFNGTHVYFESAAVITSLILLGRYLELKTKNKASRAIKKLLELGVKKALIERGGKKIEINIEDVVIGDVIFVKPGEKVPIDGIILKGESNLDESMLSGESVPVFKKEGGQIFGATINLDGILEARVNKKPNETMLARIIQTVESVQSYKAPVQKMADKIAGIFVPIIIILSFLTFLGWYFWSGSPGEGLIHAVAVLIISCPCALGIAVPIAVMAGTSAGAKKGILVKNGESFEKARKIDTIVFDKTGTLSEGKLVVQSILFNNSTKDHVLKVGASLASASNHPVARAISFFAKNKKTTLSEMKNFKEYGGLGVGAECRQHETKLFLGNKNLFKKEGFDISWAEEVLKKNKTSGETVNFVSHGEEIIGAFFISDRIKKESKEAVQKIEEMKFDIVMLSGDNLAATSSFAQKAGIKKYFAEITPLGKLEKIKNMQKNGRKVAFAGDGINDAPALLQADLGIAMASGSDIAKESGDIVIINNNPLSVPEAIQLSKKTYQIIKQNLFWAFFYNISAIPLAAFGLINPMLAAFAMGFSSVSIILNSLRIYK